MLSLSKKDMTLVALIIIALIIFIGITYYQTIIKGQFKVVNIEPELDI